MAKITCCVQYRIVPGKRDEFAHYARVWRRIIERLGGTHHGCFMPGEQPPDAEHFSFPTVGQKGPDEVAVILFSFDDLAAYERYRREARNDPECAAVTAHYNQTQCFTSYERTFLTPLDH
ncbi:MAG TPA: NIPSNAP family protein [Pyrinomonadaceae bacterium]